eukprot:snap_masked-scaffold_91-processed-gene-0.19-mRNA-1 protein AED:1.00 eAED:1.00 QI:0/-1/0/0/-1/1/1/0/91
MRLYNFCSKIKTLSVTPNFNIVTFMDIILYLGELKWRLIRDISQNNTKTRELLYERSMLRKVIQCTTLIGMRPPHYYELALWIKYLMVTFN